MYNVILKLLFFFKGFESRRKTWSSINNQNNLWAFNQFNLNQTHKSGFELPSLILGFTPSLLADGRFSLVTCINSNRTKLQLHSVRAECWRGAMRRCVGGRQADRQTDRHSWGRARPGPWPDERGQTQWNVTGRQRCHGYLLTQHSLATTSQRAASADIGSVNRRPECFYFSNDRLQRGV